MQKNKYIHLHKRIMTLTCDLLFYYQYHFGNVRDIPIMTKNLFYKKNISAQQPLVTMATQLFFTYVIYDCNSILLTILMTSYNHVASIL